MQTFTYEEIREKALKQGVTNNRLRVGLWASSNGYIKSKRKIQKNSKNFSFPETAGKTL